METAFIFYWLSWMLWIILTFIHKKGKRRLFLSALVLVMINVSTTEIVLFNYQVNMLWLAAFLGGICLLASLPRKFLPLMGSFCWAFGYAGLLFWELISPVWVLVSRNLIIPVVSVFFLCLLSDRLLTKCAIWAVGLCGGEVFHSIILQGYGMRELIGEPAFQNLLVAGIAANLIFYSLSAVKQYIDLSLQRLDTKLKVGWNHE